MPLYLFGSDPLIPAWPQSHLDFLCLRQRRTMMPLDNTPEEPLQGQPLPSASSGADSTARGRRAKGGKGAIRLTQVFTTRNAL